MKPLNFLGTAPRTISFARGGPNPIEEDMNYSTPLALFEDRADAELPLPELAQAYYDFLAGREQPASPHTIRDYRGALESFSKSLALNDKPQVVGQVSRLTVRQWVKDQREGTLPSARIGRASEPCTEGSIGPRYAALKAFTRGFIFRELKLTKRDLLEDLPRWKNKDHPKRGLTDLEIKDVRESFPAPSFECVRDRTIFEVHMATAFRYDTVMGIQLASLNRITGAVTVITKGKKTQLGKVDSAGLSHIRAYLRLRPDTTCTDLFVQGDGKPLTYDGARNIWRRIQKRSGVRRLGSHLIRYTVAQRAALAGASVADIQGILGHESDIMARHYIGDAHKLVDADTMAKHSLAAA